MAILFQVEAQPVGAHVGARQVDALVDARQVGAQAGWDNVGVRSLELLERASPWVFVAILAIALTFALRRGHRYRLRDELKPESEPRVREAIVAVERRTSGEVVPVVLGRSDTHPAAGPRSALALLVLGSVLLQAYLPWHTPLLAISFQVGLAAIGFGLARLIPGWRRLFVTEKRATELALEQAGLEFQRLELDRTEGRTGVLIFVSLFERRVIVLGDSGIHAKVGDAHWARTRDAVLSGIERDDLAAGLIAGIQACGEVLIEHFPAAEGDRNEVPDRLIVRPE
jgi:putative membrane protein